MGDVSYLVFSSRNIQIKGLLSESTYTFSPVTGLIDEHVVNSIHPAPHQAVYDSLRLSLGKILGLEWSNGAGSSSPNGAAYKGKI